MAKKKDIIDRLKPVKEAIKELKANKKFQQILKEYTSKGRITHESLVDYINKKVLIDWEKKALQTQNIKEFYNDIDKICRLSTSLLTAWRSLSIALTGIVLNKIESDPNALNAYKAIISIAPAKKQFKSAISRGLYDILTARNMNKVSKIDTIIKNVAAPFKAKYNDALYKAIVKGYQEAIDLLLSVVSNSKDKTKKWEAVNSMISAVRIASAIAGSCFCKRNQYVSSQTRASGGEEAIESSAYKTTCPTGKSLLRQFEVEAEVREKLTKALGYRKQRDPQELIQKLKSLTEAEAKRVYEKNKRKLLTLIRKAFIAMGYSESKAKQEAKKLYEEIKKKAKGDATKSRRTTRRTNRSSASTTSTTSRTSSTSTRTTTNRARRRRRATRGTGVSRRRSTRSRSSSSRGNRRNSNKGK